ncbi:DNA-processing protein DprA [Novosphingobium sp. BW1]|uniref:DNA-processing protein DprA n=1 Tax=Novosphingobium sp. BW1 TaxID=2592621 RepID=UPI0011DEC8AC|nr:DNA-processing protein DprA [Novosphingobium sp. BW1]TYC86945.1 DNA-protecting protein DprA [Novosphingobium sp. BW1]
MDEAKAPTGTVEKERLQLSQEEAFARIRLLRSPNVGPVSYRQLLSRFGSAVAALEALPDLAGKGGKRYTAAPVKRIDAETSAMRKLGARYLFHDSPDYPALLTQVSGAPPILTCMGDLSLLHRPGVATVGARNASAAAVRLARDFAYGLAQAGFTVVSGLARGIDGAAHQGALAAGGATVGVIASGIDIAYPPEHEALQAEIGERGLLLAEQPCGTEPLARHFPARNRIIAGLCAGTLVVEAAPKSGSLITARLAGEMGREVMAIPGSPLDPRAHGCNGLIRDGAVLVQSVEDVGELITAFDGTSPRTTFREEAENWDVSEEIAPVDDSPAEIADLLTTAPVGVDELIRQTGASPSAVQLALLELELAGRLTRHAAGRVSLSG